MGVSHGVCSGNAWLRVHRWMQDSPVAELEGNCLAVLSVAMLALHPKVAQQHEIQQRSPSALCRRMWSVSELHSAARQKLHCTALPARSPSAPPLSACAVVIAKEKHMKDTTLGWTAAAACSAAICKAQLGQGKLPACTEDLLRSDSFPSLCSHH